MKDSITINKCEEEDCSEIAPACCGNCGSNFCMEHAVKHNCEPTDDPEAFKLDGKEL